MKKIKLYFALLGLLLLGSFQNLSSQNVNVAGALVGNGTYPDLGSAFTAINGGAQTGSSIVISIVGNTTEAATATLNQGAWASLTIIPAGGASRTISGGIVGPLVDLNGADRILIDGLNTGGNALTFNNTSVGATSTIRFINDARSIAVQNCTLLGANNTITSGTVFISTSAGGGGNDSIAFASCLIDASGINFPTNGVLSIGTVGQENGTIAFSNCNIPNYFNAGAATAGILVGANNTDWTISGCRFYQAASRTYTTANTHRGIQITSGNNHVISGNIVGFATAAGTGAYTMQGVVASRFIAFDLAVGTVTASSVQGNTVTNIGLTTTSGAATANGILCGINVTAGNVNIGNLSPNTLGGAAGVDLMVGAPTTTQGAVVGINSSSTGTVVIQNNIIGGLTSGNPLTATVAGAVFGVNVSGAAASMTIMGNTIGNSTVNNMRGGVSGFTTGNSLVAGINLPSTSTNLVIANNTIQNLASFGSGTTGYVRGIWTAAATGNAASYTISGNTITNLTSNNANTSIANGQAAAVGINLAIGTNGVINNNDISNISLTGTGANQSFAAGITIGNATNPTISNNEIYNITNAGTSVTTTAPSQAAGIVIRSGTTAVNIFNNMISLGTGSTNNTAFVGIHCNHGSTPNPIDNIYHNTINITGVAAGGAQPSFGIYRGDFSATARTVTVDIRNNLVTNDRTGGTGSHFAIANNYGATVSATGWPANASNNNVLNANASTVGWWGANQTFAGWQTASAGDGASYSGITVNYVNPATNLHLNMGVTPTYIESQGQTIAAVPVDIDAQVRPGPAGSVNGGAVLPDIGADEIDAVPVFCSAASGGTVAPAASTVCQNQTVTLTSTGATTGFGISYQWMVSSTSGGPYVNVSGGSGATTTSYTTGPLSAGTFYYVLQTTCSAGPLTGLSNEVVVTVNPTPTATATSNAPICAGDTLLLNGVTDIGTSFAWTGPNGFTSTTQNNMIVAATSAASGGYSFVATLGACSSPPSLLSVAVNGLPSTVTAGSSSSTICEGSSVDLNSTASNGTMTVLSENFNASAAGWITINNSTLGTPANAAWTLRPNGYLYGATTFNSNDNTQFYMSNSDAQGSGSTTRTILQSPAFSTVGYNTLNLNFFHYFRYNAAPDSAIVEVSTNGTTWTVAQTYTATTGAPAGFVTSNVNLTPYVGNPTVYVRFRYFAPWGWYWALDNVNITGTSTAFTYNWSSAPAGFTSTLQNPTGVTPTVSTVYTVDATNVFGCSASANTSVTVNPLPVVGYTVSPNDTVCDGTSVTLSGTGAASYSWTGGITDAVPFTALATQTYTVTGTTAGCSSTTSATITVNPSPTVSFTVSPNDTVCSGDNVTLSGTGATSYSWTGGITDAVPFAAIGTQTYTVTGTTSGCSNTASATITVNPAPVVSYTVSPNDTVCPGGSITLTGTGASSYSWTGGITDGVSFIPGGSSTYTVTGTDAVGCTNTASAPIVVNSLPTVSYTATPNDTVCTGGSITLSGTGASSYTWTGGITDAVAFTPGGSLTYTVTGTDAFGCTNTASAPVVVNPLPSVSYTVSPDDTICPGGSVTLSGTGASSYAWTGGITDGVAFNPGASTTYTVTGTDAFGCTNTASAPIVVGTVPTVNLGSDIVQPSPPAVLDAGAGFTSYLWSTFETTQTINVNTNGIYYVTVTNIFGCSDSDTIQVNFTNGVMNTDGSITTISLYPNPTSNGVFSVNIANLETSNLTMEVLDMNGSVVYNRYIGSVSGNVIEPFSLTDLRTGTYVMRVHANGKSVQLRFIINE